MFGDAFPADVAAAHGAPTPVSPADTQRPESQLMKAFVSYLRARPDSTYGSLAWPAWTAGTTRSTGACRSAMLMRFPWTTWSAFRGSLARPAWTAGTTRSTGACRSAIAMRRGIISTSVPGRTIITYPSEPMRMWPRRWLTRYLQLLSEGIRSKGVGFGRRAVCSSCGQWQPCHSSEDCVVLLMKCWRISQKASAHLVLPSSAPERTAPRFGAFALTGPAARGAVALRFCQFVPNSENTPMFVNLSECHSSLRRCRKRRGLFLLHLW